MNLRGIFKRIKTPSYQSKFKKKLHQIIQDAEAKGLSKTKNAIPALSYDQKIINRERRREEDVLKKEVFKPIQQELIQQWGENTTNFLFSNRVISDVIAKKEEVLLPYRKSLVRQAAKNLKIDIEEFLQ